MLLIFISAFTDPLQNCWTCPLKPPSHGGGHTQCGVSIIIIRLKKVSGAQDAGHNDGGDDFLHGAKVLINLVHPWCNTNQLVSAYSYFSSVSTV